LVIDNILGWFNVSERKAIMLLFNQSLFHKISFTIVAMWTLSGLSSCRHEPDAASLPEVSFAGRIQPIIQSNCGKSGCHTGNRVVFIADI
jgi:hypothetical protein